MAVQRFTVGPLVLVSCQTELYKFSDSIVVRLGKVDVFVWFFNKRDRLVLIGLSALDRDLLGLFLALAALGEQLVDFVADCFVLAVVLLGIATHLASFVFSVPGLLAGLNLVDLVPHLVFSHLADDAAVVAPMLAQHTLGATGRLIFGRHFLLKKLVKRLAP